MLLYVVVIYLTVIYLNYDTVGHVSWTTVILYTSRSSCINTHPSPTGSECSCSAHSWPQSPVSHYSCSSTTPLQAPNKIPYHFQSRNIRIIHNIFYQRSPPYLKDLVAFSPSAHQRQLRSSATRSAVVRRTRTQFGRRAFSVSGPDVSNSLPTDIRLIDSQPAFRRALKTHLFNIAFN